MTKTTVPSLALAALTFAAACSGSDASDEPAADVPASEVANSTLDATTTTGETPPPAETDTPAADGVDSAALADRIRSAVADLSFEDANASLAECPVPESPAVLADLFDGLLPATSDVDLSDTAAIDESGTAVDLPVSGTALIGCAAGSSSAGVGLDIAVAPADFDGYLREFNDPESLGDVEIDVTETAVDRGGRFLQVVIDGSVESGIQGREVSWVDDNVMITAYAFGAGVDAIDLDALQQRLAEQLDTIIASALT